MILKKNFERWFQNGQMKIYFQLLQRLIKKTNLIVKFGIKWENSDYSGSQFLKNMGVLDLDILNSA